MLNSNKSPTQLASQQKQYQDSKRDVFKKKENKAKQVQQLDCHICKNKTSQISEIRLYMHNKYFDMFNFYFAKPINEILANISVQHVIFFKDYLFFDDENEYLKRYYQRNEVKPRITILTEFYINNYKQTRPNLVVTECHKIMNKRNQKLAKMFFQNQGKTDPTKAEGPLKEDGLFRNPQGIGLVAAGNHYVDDDEIKIKQSPQKSNKKNEEIPERILNSNLTNTFPCSETSNQISSQRLTRKTHCESISFESQQHDIYNPSFSSNSSSLSKNIICNLESNIDKNYNFNQQLQLQRLQQIQQPNTLGKNFSLSQLIQRNEEFMNFYQSLDNQSPNAMAAAYHGANAGVVNNNNTGSLGAGGSCSLLITNEKNNEVVKYVPTQQNTININNYGQINNIESCEKIIQQAKINQNAQDLAVSGNVMLGGGINNQKSTQIKEEPVKRSKNINSNNEQQHQIENNQNYNAKSMSNANTLISQNMQIQDIKNNERRALNNNLKLKLNEGNNVVFGSQSFANSNKNSMNKSPSPDRIWTDRDGNPRLPLNNIKEEKHTYVIGKGEIKQVKPSNLNSQRRIVQSNQGNNKLISQKIIQNVVSNQINKIYNNNNNNSGPDIQDLVQKYQTLPTNMNLIQNTAENDNPLDGNLDDEQQQQQQQELMMMTLEGVDGSPIQNIRAGANSEEILLQIYQQKLNMANYNSTGMQQQSSHHINSNLQKQNFINENNNIHFSSSSRTVVKNGSGGYSQQSKQQQRKLQQQNHVMTEAPLQTITQHSGTNRLQGDTLPTEVASGNIQMNNYMTTMNSQEEKPQNFNKNQAYYRPLNNVVPAAVTQSRSINSSRSQESQQNQQDKTPQLASSQTSIQQLQQNQQQHLILQQQHLQQQQQQQQSPASSILLFQQQQLASLQQQQQQQSANSGRRKTQGNPQNFSEGYQQNLNKQKSNKNMNSNNIINNPTSSNQLSYNTISNNNSANLAGNHNNNQKQIYCNTQRLHNQHQVHQQQQQQQNKQSQNMMVNGKQQPIISSNSNCNSNNNATSTATTNNNNNNNNNSKNTSLPVSPNRRLDLKINLNKVGNQKPQEVLSAHQPEENSYGFWTSRSQKTQNNNEICKNSNLVSGGNSLNEYNNTKAIVAAQLAQAMSSGQQKNNYTNTNNNSKKISLQIQGKGSNDAFRSSQTKPFHQEKMKSKTTVRTNSNNFVSTVPQNFVAGNGGLKQEKLYTEEIQSISNNNKKQKTQK